MDYVESMAEEHPGVRFREYLALLYRGRWVIIVSTILGLVGMWVNTAMTPPRYEARAMVLINNQKGGQGFNPFADAADRREEKLANELAILRTKKIAAIVAAELIEIRYTDSTKSLIMPILLEQPEDGKPVFATVNKVSGRLQKFVTFVPQRESDVINIVAACSTPHEAAIVARTYAYVYRDQVMMQSRSRSRSVREFLEGRLTEQREQLSKAEASVKDYMEASGVVSLDGESNRIVQELSTLEGRRNALNIEVESVTRKIKSLGDELAQQGSAAPTITAQADASYIRLLQDQLAQLEVKRDLMISQNDPAVLNQAENQKRLRDFEDQIAGLRKKLEQRSSALIENFFKGSAGSGEADAVGNLRSLKQALIESQFQLDGLRTQQRTLSDIISTYETQFHGIPRRSIELARRQRERLSAEKLYSLVEEKYNESAISEKSEFGNVDVIEEPEPSSAPVSPVLANNLLIGLILGMGLGIAIVVVKDLVDLRVQTPEQLKRHGFVSLAEVGKFEKEFRIIAKESKIPPEVRNLDKALWLIFNPLSFLAESYRRLRSSLVYLNSDRSLRMIAFTSPNPSEGKSTTISNLAISLAETQKKVVLIDADLRRPSLHRLFHVDLVPGLSDALTGDMPHGRVVHHNVIPCLDVITAGKAAAAPSVVFGWAEMGDLFKELRETYDWILVDAPPILLVNDGAVLAALSDACILTVSAGNTRLESLDRSKELVEAAGGRILGVVINRFDARLAYGAYYGSYRYGHYDTHDGYGDAEKD
jgi:capsular exopolysaccharide synthesis family protein